LKWFKKIKELIFFDTFGSIATDSFLICGISGIILAVFFDVNDPYGSISLILITNPGASFFRDIHYWSAQFFLIFTILHLWDHLKGSTYMTLTRGVWLRLCLSIMVVFFIMITGFILKGDADSLQAGRIIVSLVEKIPLAGSLLSSLLFGSEENYQLIYVHHIATATVFLAIIIWEHARSIWSRLSSFLIILFFLSLVSVFLHAPLHDNISLIVKGPWYFVGLQEVLHWMNRHGWIWIIFGLLLLSISILLDVNDFTASFIKKGLYFLFLGYVFLTFSGYFFRGENWSWRWPWKDNFFKTDPFRVGPDFSAIQFSKYAWEKIPTVNGRKEACLICHEKVTGLSAAHDPQALGCTWCHLGDPFSLDLERAHNNMILIPGNLDNASETCGTTNCHPEIVSRINKSLMTNNSGLVSIDRFIFEETHSPDILSDIRKIGHSAADEHLRNLCSNCHLGFEKTKTGPIDEISRGGGCNACHLNYSEKALSQHLNYINGDKNEKLVPQIHPALDLKISSNHCFGCHSRSGRISTNYEGWNETLLDEKDLKDTSGYKILQDKRVYQYAGDDIHHEKGMECIDCHGSFETMGDGIVYHHEEESEKVHCEDCHFRFPPQTINYGELDEESKKIFDLKKYNLHNRMIAGGVKSDAILTNAYFENDKPYLIGKNSGKVHPMNPPASVCVKAIPHGRLTCSSCHSAWVPQCIGCHNEFNKNSEGYDLLRNKPVKGTWIEYVGQFIADPPSFGVRTGNKNKIEPCAPGMILTIDKTGFSNPGNNDTIIFHRLYAPVSPHTTSIKGRTCKSCHNNSLALGYGRGELIFKINKAKGKWTFHPEFIESKFDGLPEDAWIEFLSEPKGIFSTRNDFRPFTIEEQRKILTVGACLTCHDENSRVILQSMDLDFREYLKKISTKCVLPAW
jgi:hypothetical protein